MFERYTEPARRSLFFARFEASTLGDPTIDSVHLLLGILREAKGTVRRILNSRNVTYADVRAEYPSVAEEHRLPTSVEIPFSEDAKRALNRAAVEADLLEHPYIGAEHLLIALLHDETSKGGSIARSKGLTAEAARRDLRPPTLRLELPPLPEPAGNYVHAVRTGNLVFLAGKGAGATTGKVGRDIAVDEAYQIARATGLILLSALRTELGSLDRVVRIVKVTGFINAAPEFAEHPKVINGCSDLFVEVFGERGRHARSAIGVASLPGQIPVEIEAIVEVS